MRILVIAVNGNVRNKNLLSREIGGEVFPGIDGTSANFRQDIRINQNLNEIYIGKTLSNTELATVASHFFAQLFDKSEWTCILEDDAIVINDLFLKEVLNLIEKIQTRRPTLISLYPGFGGIYSYTKPLNKNFSLMRSVHPATGAVGYVVNRACKKKISSQKFLIGPADFPSWIHKTSVYSVYPSVIAHSFESTLKPYLSLQKGRQSTSLSYRTSILNSFSGLTSFQLTRIFGGINGYIRSVIFPRFWKMLLSKIPF